MCKININEDYLKNSRNGLEMIQLTNKEQELLSTHLGKLEDMLPEKCDAIFSVSKQDGVFSGSLNIKPLRIYSCSKDSSTLSLFQKLYIRIKIEIESLYSAPFAT